MAEQLKSSFSVSYIEEEINKTTRFLDSSIYHEPVSYNHGEATLPGGMANHELVTNVNLVHVIAESPISIKLGDSTNPEHLNMRQLSYDGESTAIFVSNPSTDPVKVQYVSAKF